MARFVIEGMVAEEPAYVTLPNGATRYKRLRIEEQLVAQNGKPYVTTHEVRFFGKMAEKIPENIDLTGCRAIVVGILRSSDFNGKNYHDLYGDTFILESQPTFESANRQAIPPEAMGDQDLPF